MSSKLDYRIRQYQPSDLPQIRALLYEGFVTSKGSVADVGVRRALTQPPCIVGYAHVISGSALFLASRCHTVFPLLQRIPFSQTTQTRLGIALCVVGTALIVSIRGAIRHYLRRFCDDALKADMRDIDEWYCKPGGGFWVAVRPRKAIRNGSAKAGEVDGVGEDEEVLGYVGLEYQPNSPPNPLRDPTTTAEIRRMIVAEAHRRKGLANALMHATLAHADAISHPRLEYVFLGTSDLQPAAQTLYERLGFVTVREEAIGNWAGSTMLREYRRTGRARAGDQGEGFGVLEDRRVS
ncbi:acyl-CoA N-acyltransferase [Mycena amicta]|nr:acyl-CoA N-acyltransferase [Mycena amicta]